MKLKLKAIAMSLVFVIAATAAAGCGGKRQEVDTSRTQLYIGNYSGGVGSRWLEEYKTGFEQLYAETEFEPGKKGVEVIIDNDKTLYDGGQIPNSIANSAINLYFTERAVYYDLVRRDLLYDITEGVTTPLDNGEKSIADKMNADLRSYFCVDKKYYGVAHYETYRGFIYDIDLFDDNGLYMIQTDDGSRSIGGHLGVENLSAGPEGDLSTVYDNGLPATYDDFFWWCGYVKTYKNIIPICWDGADKESYTHNLMTALQADANGEQNKYMQTLTEFDNITIDMVEFDSAGNPKIVQGTVESRKDFLKMKGYYYAADFMKRILENNYYYGMSMNIIQTAEMTQYDFLHSRFDTDLYASPIAMMADGTWWEEEANGLFEDMSHYENAGRYERRLGFLPLPKISEEYLGAPTLMDGNQSVAFVNGNCNSVQAGLAVKFLRYITTEENLQKFNVITGLGRDYEYKLTDEQYQGLSAFAKSVYDVSNSANVSYGVTRPYETWLFAQQESVNWYTSDITLNGENNIYSSAISALNNSNITTKMYFEGVLKYNGVA